ncbi:MAG: helicase/secretion neighborhood TadE-like protein [Acidobacteriaceae bacterium]|nr:helicase/secretion neighborhood TadE-like protein [Acidobacteriaceae bacterium]
MKANPVFAKSSVQQRNERGMTIIMVALSIFLIMAMAALAVDVGVLYTARTSAQHAADAAALAGAYTFSLASEPQPDSARNAAIAMAAKNSVMGTAVTITASDVLVEQDKQRVTVTVNRNMGGNPINTFFAGALGISAMGTQARAVAEAAKSGSASSCVKPIFAANTTFSALPPRNPADPTQSACGATPKQVIFNTDGTLTDWVKTLSPIGKCLETRPTRPQDAKADLAPGQFYSLDFGSGANTYRCTWGSCLNQCPNVNSTVIQCGKSYPLETGDMVGPTGQGVTNLIGNPADLWKAPDQYYPGGDKSKIVDTSRALAVLPVWDDCNNTITPGTSGQKVPVLGFLKVFVDGQGKFQSGCLGPSTDGTGKGNGNGGQSDWVKTHIVSAITCTGAGGGGGSGTPSTGPFGVPIRLVQVPNQ